MATNDEEVVLQFTVKGSQVAVRQISQVEQATGKLDSTTKSTADNGASSWERYAKSAGSSLLKLGKIIALSEFATAALSKSVLSSLALATRNYRTGSMGLAAAAAFAGKNAAKALEEELIGGAAGAKGIIGTIRKMAGMLGAGGTLGKALAGGATGLTVAGLTGGAALANRAGMGWTAKALGAGASTVGTLGLGGTLAAVGGGVGLAYGAKKLLDFGVQGMGGARDQIEYRNQVDALYGTGSAQARLGSVDPAKNMGLSRTQYLQAYGGFSGQLLGGGLSKGQAATKSSELVQLAADLGSFKNVDSDVATTALQAGLRGENDPLETIGVFLNQKSIDIQSQKLFNKKGSQNLTTNELMQARLAAITESAGANQARGDYLRSSPTSLANQQRSAAAAMDDASQKLGASLNKILLAVMPLAAPLIDLLNFVVDIISPAIDLIATLLKPVVWTLTTISSTLKFMSGQNPADERPGAYTSGGLTSITAPTGFYRDTKTPLGSAIGQKEGESTWDAIKRSVGFGGPSLGGFATGGTVPGWSPGIDNMLVPLSGGEGILTPETVAMMGGPGQVDRMNRVGLRKRGGYANGIGAAATTASMYGGGGFGGGIYLPAAMRAPATATAGTGAVPGSSVDNGALVGAEGTVSAADFLGLAQRILQEKGMNPGDAIHILHQAEHESSLRVNPGSPNDVNARNGSGGSQGILQFIKPTFDAYADPGHTNFMGVEDQIRALTNYVPDRYGSIAALATDRGYGAYGAYDSGGWLQPGVTQTVNKTGEPEAVLTQDQWKDVKALSGVGKGGGGGVQVHIGSINIDGGDAGLASQITDRLGDAIAQRINRANDRRL